MKRLNTHARGRAPELSPRAKAVQATHAKLARTTPGFTEWAPRHQFKAVQAALRRKESV